MTLPKGHTASSPPVGSTSAPSKSKHARAGLSYSVPKCAVAGRSRGSGSDERVKGSLGGEWPENWMGQDTKCSQLQGHLPSDRSPGTHQWSLPRPDSGPFSATEATPSMSLCLTRYSPCPRPEDLAEKGPPPPQPTPLSPTLDPQLLAPHS